MPTWCEPCVRGQQHSVNKTDPGLTNGYLAVGVESKREGVSEGMAQGQELQDRVLMPIPSTSPLPPRSLFGAEGLLIHGPPGHFCALLIR